MALFENYGITVIFFLLSLELEKVFFVFKIQNFGVLS